MSAAEPSAAASPQVVPHNRPWLLAEDIDAVSASIATGWLAPGPEVAALERDFTRLHGGDFKRVAVVTDSQWVAWSAWLEQLFVKADLRVFEVIEDARAWLAEESA